MGSEQSSQQRERGGESSSGRGPAREQLPRSPSSPQSSVCSDSEVSYVSYAQGQPIGGAESPKPSVRRLREAPGQFRSRLRSRLTSATSQASHSSPPRGIVLVRSASVPASSDEEDEELRRLKRLPNFSPIIRGAASGQRSVKPDLEILQQIDGDSVRQLAGRLQHHLADNAKNTAAAQNALAGKISALDLQLTGLLSAVTDRQKCYAKHAEHFQQVHHVSRTLTRCRHQLQQAAQLAAELNEQLPEEHQLQPFSEPLAAAAEGVSG